jgi:hypothetical protein
MFGNKIETRLSGFWSSGMLHCEARSLTYFDILMGGGAFIFKGW